MIEFIYELDGFKLSDEEATKKWIAEVIDQHDCELGDLTYTFCDDEYLHKINVEYLDHDNYTDIISFDYSMDQIISGEIFLSVERVEDNAKDMDNSFIDELDRVIIHGILHYIGFKDKTSEEQVLMRKAEDNSLSLRAKI